MTSFNSLHPGNFFFFFFLPSADFFLNQLFQKTLSGIPTKCQTDWIQISLRILTSLIWFQTVCRRYQQTTLGGIDLKCNWSASTSFNSLPPGNFFFRLLIFSKWTFSKNSFRNTFRVSNRLDPDQAQHFVGCDLVPNCLQKISADDT